MDNEWFEKYGYPPCYADIQEYWKDWKMADKIDYKAMNDHDLLVMSVMQGNETVRHLEKLNNSVSQHERRITILETITTRPVNLTKKQAAGIGGSVFIFGAFLAGVVNAIGKAIGVW